MAEGAKKFKFVSPGIYFSVIDNSQLERQASGVGPVVITRAKKGPGLRPVRVESRSELVQIFGEPTPGGNGNDPWRQGDQSAPTYGMYAAFAYLKNSAPVTVVRLMGSAHTEATAGGAAGWETKDSSGNFNGLSTGQDGGGAYGLFIIDSGSATSNLTGALAAVFYVSEGTLALSGTLRGSSTPTTGSAVFVESLGDNQEFKLIAMDENSTITDETTFNFSENSARFIRKVFNTNPTLTNSAITRTSNLKKYWLGETFERHLSNTLSNSGAGQNYAVLLGLKGDAATKEGSDFRKSTQEPKSGWIISQDLQVVLGTPNTYNPANMTQLFRFVGLNTGEWVNRSLKVSIEDIKKSPTTDNEYGTFTVSIRQVGDNDNSVKAIERFTGCNLNPFSANYVGKKIGDKYVVWDDTERRYIEYGNYENRSKFVRLEINADVDAGATNPSYLPFGFLGPVRHKGFTLLSGSANANVYGSDTESLTTTSFVKAAGTIARANVEGAEFVNVGNLDFTGSFEFPKISLRTAASAGNLASPQDAYWGIDTTRASNTRLEPSYADMVRTLPDGYDSFSPTANETEYSFLFSLDDVSGSGINAVYSSGSRAAGTSLTAVFGSYEKVLDSGFDKFTLPLNGGFDGLDITEKEPFRNTLLDGGTDTTNYAFNSVKRAIDAVSDPEVLDLNVLTMPGLTNTALTNQIIDVADSRNDCLAVIDVEGGYVPNTENTTVETSRLGSASSVISNLRSRNINTHVAATYHPWLRYQDTISGASFWGPPSIAALGSFAYTEASEELWYAPAGVDRGGLSDGIAGLPVTSTREKLRQKDRDALYEAGVNPIASFPDTGVVIWGQKTLKMTPSALDRINVVRMLNFIKKAMSGFSAATLFQPNVKQTWNSFLGRALPFLESIQSRFGLDEFKLILDETTTTAELRDRNIVYGKLFLKPTKAIEFFAFDVSIESSGASFAE